MRTLPYLEVYCKAMRKGGGGERVSTRGTHHKHNRHGATQEAPRVELAWRGAECTHLVLEVGLVDPGAILAGHHELVEQRVGHHRRGRAVLVETEH